MEAKEREAMQLMTEGDKLVTSGKSFFGRMFGGSMKLEDACEKYDRAGNLFKMAKKWSAAGSAFCKSSELKLQLQNKYDGASKLIEAGNCFRKSDANEAIKCISDAIDIYTDMGKFTVAAKHHVTIAEVYETETNNIEKAISHYEQAADFYKGEEATSSANKCLLKVASYAAQLEQYTKAIDLYEEVAGNSMDSPLLKYSVKEYFFKAALCRFCMGGSIDAKQGIEKYEGLFPAFSDSRECSLLKKLIVCYEKESPDEFAEKVAEYDSISRIDQWLTTILLRIKKTITGDDEENDLT